MKVSCIIPVGPDDRSHLLPVALRSYLSQDWPDKELVVIDDGDHEAIVSSFVPGAVYVKVAAMTIGAKRNLACERASGEVIIHFDSDDWSARDRVRDQIERLESGHAHSGAQMSGYHSVFYWSMLTDKAYRYVHQPQYSLGSAMCYFKSFWKTHPFPDRSHSEDNHVTFQAKNAGQLVSSDGFQRLICRVHQTNVTQSAMRVGRNNWPQVSSEWLSPAFFEAINR